MIRIFVGCASGDDIESQAVLEYTLRLHASQPFEITWMQQSRDPSSPFHGWRTETWSTPFSGFRWAVPELCNFEGRAIYMDSDCIVMADIAELWNQRIQPGKCVLAKGAENWRFCVSLWGCSSARPLMMPINLLKATPGAHQTMISQFVHSKAVLPFKGNWNCIDGEDYADLNDPDIKVIHYSSENTQPHLLYAVPRLAKEGRDHWFDGRVERHWRKDIEALFDKMLSAAKAAGFDPENYQPAQPFGSYRIASHKNYHSHRWAKTA